MYLNGATCVVEYLCRSQGGHCIVLCAEQRIIGGLRSNGRGRKPKLKPRRLDNVSAVSGFCKKCNNFRKRYCGGDRNTCMTILFDRIEVLQHENNVAIERAMRAETLVRELVGVIDDLLRQINECGLDNEMWEVYERAKEVLEDD